VVAQGIGLVSRKVVCVLKRSDDYDFDYVDKIERGLGKFLPGFELETITDPPWPRWWSKIAMFAPEVTGDFLYLDLDTVIVGKIDDLFTGKLTVLADFNLPKPKFMATGVMFVPEADREEIWRNWIADPEYHMRKHGGNGDGGFLSQFWKHKAARWQEELPGKIVSYKVHWRKGEGRDASVVCFHGKPRPRDLNWSI
jgi:hypothetical protein